MTNDAIDHFETQRWKQEGWERGRDGYIAKLKATVSGLVKRRIESFEWANEVVAVVEQAHAAMLYGERLTGPKLAKYLNDHDVKLRVTSGSNKKETVGKARANALLFKTDAMMIEAAVEECRTLMTARCLSANFEDAELGELEQQYVEIIADIIALGRRLRNQMPMSRDWLLTEAHHQAKTVARDQRKRKPVTMAARERYWRDRPAPIRKIFED